MIFISFFDDLISSMLFYIAKEIFLTIESERGKFVANVLFIEENG